MRRRSNKFYKELAELRDKYGDYEYDRDDLLPAAMALLRDHLDDEDELLRDAATTVLDRFDRADEEQAQGFFGYKTHTKLGDKKRIKRGRMNLEQNFRRKRVIDKNKIAQDGAWADETQWINDNIDALQGRPPETTVDMVLPEDRSAKAAPADGSAEATPAA